MDRDLREFINESFISSPDEVELMNLHEAVIEEGVNIDIYNKMKEFKSKYDADLKEFYSLAYNGDTVKAKAKIKEIQNNIHSMKNEISKMDDSGFKGKVGGICLSILINIGKITMTTLSGMFVNAAQETSVEAFFNRKEIVKNIKAKNFKSVASIVKSGIPKVKDLKKGAILGFLFGTVPTILMKLSSANTAIQSREDKINMMMKNNNLSEEEAAKKVGNLYKSSIIDYLNNLDFSAKQMELNLGTGN